jgi:acetolactate synthase I/II/III large subunit
VSARTEPPSTLTLGELLAERLRRAGVRRAYGFPGGGSNLDLFEAFEDAGIEPVLSHSEGGAGFMACADAEIHGVPGVLVVGNGPGLSSAVNAVAHAWLDRVPLVVISDRYTEAEAATTGHQVLDQRALLAPVVKLGATLEAEGAEAMIDRALAAALAAPRGPVHFDLRRYVATRRVSPPDESAPPGASTPLTPALDPEALRTFARELEDARRPLVLVGLEANDGTSPADLQRLVHAAGAAVLTTYKAKGVYPEQDARWAGILTGAEIERPVLEQADVVLAVGLDAVELLGRPWTYGARVLSVAACEAADAYLRPAHRVVGSVADAVRGLAALLGSPNAGFSEAAVMELRETALRRLRLDDDLPLPGWRVVETVAAELPPNTTISVDAGAHMFPCTNFLRPESPGRFLISNGLATMGFAVPAAVGAALARPGELSVAFTGDGGVAYHGHELETARRVGAKVVVIVFNDSSLSLIRIKQEAKGFTRRPLNFGLTRFDLLAAALGAHGVVAHDVDELRAAAADAVRRDESTLIDVRMTGSEYGRTLEAIRG